MTNCPSAILRVADTPSESMTKTGHEFWGKRSPDSMNSGVSGQYLRPRFLASAKVGNKGKVIGVDMTTEMIEKGKQNAKKGSYSNVEFHLGEVESLPVEDNSVDVVISNCVINLSPDKLATFKEAFRVLKPGGRILISDLVTEGEFPEEVRHSFDA